MVQLVDTFAKPMMCLLSAVNQWFLDNHIKHLPESIFYDVKVRSLSTVEQCSLVVKFPFQDSVDRAHPLFHALVARYPEEFLEPQAELSAYLGDLKASGKKVFLITNSPFELVNAGMTFMCGATWREIFDVIIVQSKKPNFFTKHGHFRKYLPDRRIMSWKQVHALKPGSIYARVRATYKRKRILFSHN